MKLKVPILLLLLYDNLYKIVKKKYFKKEDNCALI